MTALSLDRNLWDDIELYRNGIQPIFPEQDSTALEVNPPKGIIQLFPDDSLTTNWNAQMVSMISKWSHPKAVRDVQPSIYDGVISKNLILAHLRPASLFI